MTSYELLNFYEQVLNKIKELDAYTTELIKLIASMEQPKNQMLTAIYTSTSNIGSNGNVNLAIENEKVSIINIMKEFAMDFDVLGNHQKLIQVQNEVEFIMSNTYTILDEEKGKVTNLLNKFSNVTAIIFEYIRTRKTEVIVNLINEITIIVNEYDKFVESYKYIEDFMKKTENKVEEEENEKTLTLHFYDEYTDITEFIIRLDTLNHCYEMMCQLLNISTTEYKLKVIKIESGSFFEKFIGEGSIIDALAFLIKKTIELMFNKFTFEGHVLRQQQVINLLKENSEVIAKYKELGYEINPGIEEVEKIQSQIFRSIYKMVSGNTKIKINDEEIHLESNNKQSYLTESKTLLLGEDKSN